MQTAEFHVKAEFQAIHPPRWTQDTIQKIPEVKSGARCGILTFIARIHEPVFVLPRPVKKGALESSA